MSISSNVEVLETALWQQHDIRDPLGIWGFRLAITGDASGGRIQCIAQVPADKRSAYVYTVLDCNVTATTQGTAADVNAQCRILTNWPNIDPQPDVQAYGHINGTLLVVSTFTAPLHYPRQSLVRPQDRFLVIWDPRAVGIAMDIISLQYGANILNDVVAFEGYGYFWDRSVMDGPGGLRHPGSS